MLRSLPSKHFAALSTILILLAGCKLFGAKGGGVSSQSGATLLTEADLAPDAVQTTASTSIVSYLADDSNLYDHQPANADDSGTSSCQSALNKTALQATKDTATYFAKVDFAACDSTATSHYISDTPLQLLETWTCTGGDLSSYNGKTAADLATIDLSSCRSGTVTWQVKGSFIWVQTGSGAGTYTSNTVGFFGTPDLQPCPYTTDAAGTHFATGCIVVAKSDTRSPAITAPSEFYSKYAYAGITKAPESAKAEWFTAGQMQIIYDNWTGTLTYTGASTSPTYSLSAPGQQSMTGSLVPATATPAPAASLALTGPGLKVKSLHLPLK